MAENQSQHQNVPRFFVENQAVSMVALVAVVFLGILSSQSATPGKLILGLIVTREDGQSRIDFQTALMRSLPGLAGVIPGINLVVGLVMIIGSIVGILNDAERRSFYDRIGKTRVVYKARL